MRARRQRKLAVSSAQAGDHPPLLKLRRTGQAAGHLAGGSPGREPRPHERGAVLVILALVAVVLLLFAGLGIDGAILTASKTQQKYNAEYVALGALKRYLDAPGDWGAKLEEARLRAQEIAGMNVYVGSPFQQVQGYSQEFGTNDPSTPLARTGVIVPGLWHTQPPLDCTVEVSPCPCLTGSYNGPCFEELRLDLPENATKVPNAFRAILFLRDDAPINTLFAGAGGSTEHVSITSQATATTYPNHGVFLVDLSRSQHFETHVPYETTGGPIETPRSAESAFKLSSVTCLGDHSNPCPTAGSCAFDGGAPPGLYSAVYNFTPELIQNTRLGAMGAQKHYKDDFKCYTVNYTEDGGTLKTENYLVDAYSGATTPSGYYDGAEPLMTILYGVNKALQIIEDEAIPGTLVGAIGFDRSATINVRRFDLSSPGQTNFDDLKSITDITNQTDETKRKRYEDHLFFPRIDGYANFPAALNEAKEMLKNAPLASTSQNFVTIFSDGLTNCTEAGACGADEAYYLASLNESLDIILNDYTAEGIRLHFVHVGSRVRPHTMLTASFVEPDACMTENEARFNNPPLSFVDESGNGIFTNVMKQAPSAGFYYDPAKFYEAARATEGFWFPLRPCCLSGPNCSDVRSQLDVACDAATPGYTGDMPDPVVVSPHTDAQGRLWCDPKGRDRRAQLDEFMRTLLAETQFATVENF